MRTECIYYTDGGVQLQALVKAAVGVNKAVSHGLASFKSYFYFHDFFSMIVSPA